MFLPSPSPQFSVLSSQFSVLSSQFSILSSQFSVLSSQFSVLSSQFAVFSSQFAVFSSQFAVLAIWTEKVWTLLGVFNDYHPKVVIWLDVFTKSSHFSRCLCRWCYRKHVFFHQKVGHQAQPEAARGTSAGERSPLTFFKMLSKNPSRQA